MFQLNALKTKLSGDVNIRAIALLSGVSEKTVHRIKNGETDTTFGTANKILAAVQSLYPTRKSKATA